MSAPPTPCDDTKAPAGLLARAWSEPPSATQGANFSLNAWRDWKARECGRVCLLDSPRAAERHFTQWGRGTTRRIKSFGDVHLPWHLFKRHRHSVCTGGTRRTCSPSSCRPTALPRTCGASLFCHLALLTLLVPCSYHQHLRQSHPRWPHARGTCMPKCHRSTSLT